jgi:hypothetical protein
MKMTLKQLREMGQTFDRLLAKEMDVKLAYRMRKIAGKIVNELKGIDDIHAALLRKYGTPIPKQPGRVQVPEDKMDAFSKEFEDLLSVEVDLGVELIPYECIENLGKISGFDMTVIAPLLAEPETKTEGVKPPLPPAR